MINCKHPAAACAVTIGEDPEGVSLTPTMEAPAATEVLEIVVERPLQY